MDGWLDGGLAGWPADDVRASCGRALRGGRAYGELCCQRASVQAQVYVSMAVGRYVRSMSICADEVWRRLGPGLAASLDGGGRGCERATRHAAQSQGAPRPCAPAGRFISA